MQQVVKQVIERIRQRSLQTRGHYLRRIEKMASQGKSRATLSCGNLAHAIAACSLTEKAHLMDFSTVNVAIISAYNDMLSAHAPYQHYPDTIKATLKALGHTAQVAGGVPAMCDGVTQGQAGMDLSLFSRDLIAQATVLALSHNTFDATLLLGICDKIAPGQLMGALSFGHLPTAFVPSGPMSTGISNDEKVSIRQAYAAGKVDKAALQTMENRAYHAPGTCTFYGTANTNQLVFEAMGLMLPGSAFVPFNAPLRHALTEKIAQHMVTIARGESCRSLAETLDEYALVNGIVALLASGGSTNHTIHLVAVARAAGFILTWDDFDALSNVVPLLVKIYPNGPADINAFEQVGGVPTLMAELARRGLLAMAAKPVFGTMEDYLTQPVINSSGELVFIPCQASRDTSVISQAGTQFSQQGGLKVLKGNLGTGIIKISAVAESHRQIEAPAKIFESQHAVEQAYKQGLLNQDCIIVVRHNGPAANGMPELHKLMPLLGNLMNAGHKVALVTDGRLSGASGKVPAAIHLSPEAAKGGPLSRLQEGDMIRLDADLGLLETTAVITERSPTIVDLTPEHEGLGREWFGIFRQAVSSAEAGATILPL